jgi:hypothetical protein
MEPEGSLTCSQKPSTGPYPEPDQSNPSHPILSSDFIYYMLFSTHEGNKNYRTADLVKHAVIFFCKVAYSNYDVPSEMFLKDNKQMKVPRSRTLAGFFLLSNKCILVSSVFVLRTKRKFAA